ncbi:hypothetical protein ACOSQ2_017195 [Xanthoceras sorbifolium]
MVQDVFENGGAVYVRGRQVHMTVKAINDYYRLDTDADHVDWEALNPKCIAYRDALAQDLGTIRQPTRTSSGIVMFREQLKLDSAFWNEFSYYSVLPTRVDVYGEDEIVIQPPLNLDRATYNALGCCHVQFSREATGWIEGGH